MPSEPMPAPGDASGETADNFEAALSEYVEAALDCAAHDSNQPYERLRGRRELARQQVMRLYRAATGEVVAEGRITAVLPDAEGTYYLSVQVQGNWQDVRSSLRAPVAVVLRRDKEEG